jgi:hypothetical protein
MTRTVIALFDNFSDASKAVNDLTRSGIARDQISLMANDAKEEYRSYLNRTDTDMDATPTADGASAGAGIGAVIGAVGGLLVGLGALAIPGVGPVIAAGPLAAALSGLAGAGVGAVAGGVTGGLLGALVDMGIPEETAHYYAEGVRRGGTLVSVQTDESKANRAVEILNDHDPIDINQRATQWRETGWTGFDVNSEPYTFDTTSTLGAGGLGINRSHATDDYIDERASRGMYTEPKASNPLRTQTFDPANPTMRQGSYKPETGGETTINTSSSARDDVYKPERGGNVGPEGETWDKGSYHPEAAGETTINTYSENRGDLYKPEEGGDMTTDFSVYDERFRHHYESSMAGTDYTYDYYQPAYRYGYELAHDNRYRGYDWNRLEPEAHRYWDERNPGSWERFKMAVRHAWEEVKDAVD